MRKFFLQIMIFTLLGSCKTNTELIPFNFAQLYNYKMNSYNTQIKVLNISDQNTSVYVGLNTSGLIKDKNNYIRLKYEILVYRNLNLTRIRDSVNYFLKVLKSDLPVFLAKKFALQIKPYPKYYMKITISDLVKNTRTDYFKSFSKDSLWRAENFKFTDIKRNTILLSPYLKSSQPIKIESSYLGSKKAKIFYFSQKFPLALPPFYMKPAQDFMLKADSIWEFSFSNNFRAGKRGIYHFRPNNRTKTGFVFYNFGEYYPKQQTSLQLSESFRYLMSKKEFSTIKKSKDLKLAVDSFWLAHSENKQRASTLIRGYYERVQAANIYFTSTTAGWRSDRGMIYIVIGEPSNVYKYKDREVWRYGARLGFKAVEFIFWKIKNPISDNYYVLERSLKYKPIWYKAVETWRSGQIYKYRNR